MASLFPSVKASSLSLRREDSPAKLSFACSRRVGNLSLLKNDAVGVGVGVSSRTKGLEVGVTDSESNVGLYGQFSSPAHSTASPSQQSQEDEEKQKFYVNTGYAIRTLRKELPNLFYEEPSFDTYRDDIVFEDPVNVFAGIENYKTICWALRFCSRVFFSDLWLDILNVWQPEESVIMVRWAVHGIPRVPWESCGRFDGTSEYKLDKEGKIYVHQVYNIAINAPSRFRVLTVEEIMRSTGVTSTPKPTFFEISFPPVMNPMPLLYTWARHCLNLIIDFSRRSVAESSWRP